MPKLIVSDNAKHFKMTQNALKILFKHLLCGFYERLIGTLKRSLERTVGNEQITLVRLQTLIVEIEAVINSRPLTQLTENINDTFLTPANLLFTNLHTGLPNVAIEEDPDYMPTRNKTLEIEIMWYNSQKLLNKFWKIWKND